MRWVSEAKGWTWRFGNEWETSKGKIDLKELSGFIIKGETEVSVEKDKRTRIAISNSLKCDCLREWI